MPSPAGSPTSTYSNGPRTPPSRATAPPRGSCCSKSNAGAPTTPPDAPSSAATTPATSPPTTAPTTQGNWTDHRPDRRRPGGAHRAHQLHSAPIPRTQRGHPRPRQPARLAHPQPRAARTAILTVLRDIPGIAYCRSVTDRAGRTGIGVSATADDIRSLLILNPTTGELLAYERAALTPPHGSDRTGPFVDDYQLFLAYTHTTSSDNS